MQLKLIAAALSLALGLTHGGHTLAAGDPPARPIGKRLAQASSEDLLARTVFQVLLGELALRRGDAKLSSDAWTDLAQRTRDPKVVARATEIAGGTRQYERALELTKLWLEIEPDSTKAKQTQSSLLILSNRLDELAPQLTALLEQDKPNLASNLMQLNRMLAKHGDKIAVQKLVDRVATPYDGLPEAHFAMAQAAANAGDNLRALNETEKSLQLRPDWEIAAVARAQLQAQHSVGTAIESLSAFVDRNPGANDARLALARLLTSDYPDKSNIHFFLGQLDHEEKKPDSALEHFRQVTAGPQYIAARSRSALILMHQGKIEAARELLHNTQSSTPAERVELTLAESQLLREAGRHNDAYIVLDSALSTLPDSTELIYEAALTAERIGKPELLESHIKHLLAIKPDHAHALNALGYSLAERNVRLAEARDLIAKAQSLAPEDPFIMDSMGWVLYRQGKLPDALRTLENAYRIKADPEIAAHLGEVLWAMNRKDEARRILSEAAKANPDNEVLAGTIKKLLP